MNPHTNARTIINAPITTVWHQLWQNFKEESQLTKNTKISKNKADTIERTVTINDVSHKQKLVKHEKEKTIKNSIIDGNIFGQFTYEIQQNAKGEVFLLLDSNVIDANKKPFPTKAALDYELAIHKQLIEHKHKRPKKKGLCC